MRAGLRRPRRSCDPPAPPDSAFLGAFFAVLFSSKYPEGIRYLLVGVYRHALRVEAFAGLLTDTYPPFQLA